MKKTLIISMEFPPHIGGISTYVHHFARTLDPSDVVVLTMPNADAASIDSKERYTIIRSPFLFSKLIWPRWIRLYFTVKKLVKKHKIEQIHVHHVLPVGYVAWLLRKKCSYLIFAHGTDITRLQDHPRKRYFAKRVFVAATQVIVNSTSLKDRVTALFPEVSNTISIIYPCPNPALLVPPSDIVLDQLKSSLALEGKQVVLTVSRFDDGKGIPQMVRTIAQLVPSHPNLVWLLIGDGKKRDEVIMLIRKYSLQNVVRYVGAIPQSELAPYYYISDVFSLLTHPDSSRKDEGLGIVFLEAAAAGLPIVAGNSGGTAEAVLHTKTGLVVNTYNQEEVSGAIARLLRDKPLASALGAAAKARIVSEFQWDVQIDHIRDVL
jgi:phosphatidylinositol alpha-1,6-mannosyltransferase